MGSHIDNPYTLFDGKDRAAISTALLSQGHNSGHVNVFTRINGELCVLLARNKKYDVVASFGGFSDHPEETLMHTILREFSEESLDCIVPVCDIKERLLQQSVLITRVSPKGRHYTAYVDIGDMGNFPLDSARSLFWFKSRCRHLTDGYAENSDLCAVRWSDLCAADDGAMHHLAVNDVQGEAIRVRDIVLPGYRFIREACPSFLERMNEA